MIPVRIQLSGFLCYREACEASFRGRTLWMLTGPNGSGKSALFDAVTYALFGQHRGGKKNARGLIHHGCDGLLVEFDFKLEDQLFRARRTLSRQGRSTRQILCASDDASNSEWTPVPETHNERGFNEWVDTHVALNYETFTNSVLLLQGRAENLLQATPAERRRLLCQLVGLDRIEEVAKRARRYLAEAEGAEKACREQLRQVMAVDEETLRKRRQLAERADQQAARRAADVDQLTRTLSQTARHNQLTREIEQLRAEIDQRSRQLEARRRDQVEQPCPSRYRDALSRLLENTRRIEQCEADIERWETQRRSCQASVEKDDAVLQDAVQGIEAARQELSRLTDQEKEASTRERQSSSAHSALRRFVQMRDKLLHVRTTREKLQFQIDEAEQHVMEHAKWKPCERQRAAAQEAARKAAENVAGRESLAEQLRRQYERFERVSGERVCPYCLQPLDEAHHAREKKRMAGELHRSEVELASARDRCAEAQKQESAMRDAMRRHGKDEEQLRQRVQKMAADLQATELVERDVVGQCRRAWEELPATFQEKLAVQDPRDWATSSSALRCDELARLEEDARRAGREAERLAGKRRQLEAVVAECETRQRQAMASRKERGRKLQACNEQLAQKRGQLTRYWPLQTAAQSAVPPEWRSLASDDLTRIVESMPSEPDPASASSKNLECREDPERCISELTRECQSLQAKRDVLVEQRDQISDAAQVDSRELSERLSAAEEASEQAERERTERQSELLAAEQHARTYQTARNRWQARKNESRTWKRLVKLLGHDGLQSALLEDAERAIVQYANTILDRISGGQLYVESSPASGGRSRSVGALDLVAHTSGTGGSKQEVVFLSGSQRFRVAVALSLAIGQFASHTRRPVQAVIIDEGFGCLDAMNRHVMVQELQNLRGHLQRILLVSHQDEFASAFGDGYRCELVNGATRLTPFRS